MRKRSIFLIGILFALTACQKTEQQEEVSLEHVQMEQTNGEDNHVDPPHMLVFQSFEEMGELLRLADEEEHTINDYLKATYPTELVYAQQVWEFQEFIDGLYVPYFADADRISVYRYEDSEELDMFYYYGDAYIMCEVYRPNKDAALSNNAEITQIVTLDNGYDVLYQYAAVGEGKRDLVFTCVTDELRMRGAYIDGNGNGAVIPDDLCDAFLVRPLEEILKEAGE